MGKGGGASGRDLERFAGCVMRWGDFLEGGSRMNSGQRTVVVDLGLGDRERLGRDWQRARRLGCWGGGGFRLQEERVVRSLDGWTELCLD